MVTKFRRYILNSGRAIVGGKNAETNDELVNTASRNDVMLHTSAPGSPFVNVGTNPDKEEILEAAVFCAKYSQDWRDNKRDVIVNKFLRGDMSKSPMMKNGLWSAKRQTKIKVGKEDIFLLELTLNNDKGI